MKANHGWWWHLWNDPMIENPWSLVLLFMILGVIGAAFWWLAGWRQRRYLRRELQAQGEAYRRTRRGN